MLSKKAPPFWYLKSPASQPGAISLRFIIQQAEKGRKMAGCDSFAKSAQNA
jgi:hypothetical protein